MSTVKWSLAHDLEKKEVHIIEAVSGRTYFCIACGSPMKVIKSDRKAHHFAHIKTPDNYSYESELHIYCKKLLFNYLKSLHQDNESFIINQPCYKCSSLFQIDLLSNITYVALEATFNLKGKIVRPDIALIKLDVPKYVIEIVVNHEPELEAIKAYEASNVIILEIDPTSLTEISAPILMQNVLVWIDQCPECIAKNKRMAQIEAERENKKKEHYDKEPHIRQLLASAKNKGHAILPDDLWRLFKKIQPLLTRKDDYLSILDVKKQAGMYFVDVGNDRIFVDQYSLLNSEWTFSFGEYYLYIFFRTYQKTYRYSVCIVVGDWAVKNIAVKSYASWKQEKYYQTHIEDTFDDYEGNIDLNEYLKKLFVIP